MPITFGRIALSQPAAMPLGSPPSYVSYYFNSGLHWVRLIPLLCATSGLVRSASDVHGCSDLLDRLIGQARSSSASAGSSGFAPSIGVEIDSAFQATKRPWLRPCRHSSGCEERTRRRSSQTDRRSTLW